jgi:hypothetical protein
LIKDENPELEAWLRAVSETPIAAYYASRGSDLVTIETGKKAHEKRDAVAAQVQSALAN